MRSRLLRVCVFFILIMVVGAPAIGDLLSNPASNTPLNIRDLNPTPVSASEEENIDSFNVFPSNRWTIDNDGFTATVANSLLNISDTGDNTEDYYYLSQGLGSLNDKIEVRFKYDISADSNRDEDEFLIFMDRSLGAGKAFLFSVGLGTGTDEGLQDDNYTCVELGYHGVDGGYYNLKFGHEESGGIYEDVWYKLVLTYDVLKSEFEWKLFFANNGSKVWDYDWFEIGTALPKFFSNEKLILGMGSELYTSGLTSNVYFDYIKAPFKEREWIQVDTPSDPQWLEDNWDLAHVEDDIAFDNSTWTLTVPYFDAMSGYLNINATDGSALTNGDIGYMGIVLWAVDGDDGELHMVHYVLIDLYKDAVGIDSGITIFEDGAIIQTFSQYGTSNDPRAQFSFGLHEDRSKSSLKVRFWPDQDGADYKDFLAEVDISACADDPSSEFVIMIVYQFEITGDTEWNCVLEDFSFSKKFILEGILWGLFGIDPMDGFFFLIDILLVGFFFLAQIFAWFLTPIIERLTEIFPWLGNIITELQGIASTIWGFFDEILTSLETIIDDIFDVIETIVVDIVAGIWTWFVDNIGVWFQDIIDYMLTIIADLAGMIIDIGFWMWDGFWVNVLGFASAPDLLAIIYSLGTGFIQLILGIPTFVEDIGWYIQNTWNMIPWLGVIIFLILPTLSADTIGEFFEKSISYMCKDLTMGASIIGIRIPIPIGLVWILVCMTTVLSGTSYMGFLP